MIEEKIPSGPISWMTRNTVAANLLMILFIAGGMLVASRIKQEVFPEFELDFVKVEVEYPGATPEDVEEGIVLAVEDEVRSLDGVKKVTSDSFEGRGVVSIELLTGANPGKVLQDVKNAVDKIQSLPEEAERPIVSLLEPRRQVISLILYGDLSERTLRDLGERVRDELIEIDGITLVELAAVRPLEIAIEVPQKNLRAYNLTLESIAQKVRQTALDLPGGGVKAPSGEVLLRTEERRDFAKEFSNIPVVINPDGTKVLLEDIGELKEGFEDIDVEAYFNGKKSVRVDVFRVGDQTPIDISDKVNQYTEKLNKILPSEVQVTTWNDRADIYRDRIELLTKNAVAGLVLVLILLGLFLEPRLAFWVTLGIPVSIIGSFLFIPFTGASINMISLFAFIVTLGIVVDDAIVVGENIYQKRERGLPFLQAAIEGAREISMPVVFAVLTNIAAFSPLLFVPGATGKLFLQIPSIVIAVLLVSLIESLYVLPAHLSHEHKESRFWTLATKPSKKVEKWLNKFIHDYYKPVAKLALGFRYLTLSIGVGVLVIFVGAYIGGWLPFSYIPRVDSDIVVSQAQLIYGTPMAISRQVQKELVRSAKKVIEDQKEGKVAKGIYTQIGNPMSGMGHAEVTQQPQGSHFVGTQVYLVPSDQRSISGVEFAKKWREEVENLPNIDALSFTGRIASTGGDAIDIELTHQSQETLEKAAKELGQALKPYVGVSDINDGVSLGKPQMNFTLTPEARGLGLTTNELASQVRASFYGAEALRQQRGRNEVKVMVRLPEKERESIYTVEELILRTPEGGEIPLSEAANIEFGRSYTDIKRSEGRRILKVTADVDQDKANANEIIEDVTQKVLPQLMKKYPGLTYKLSGEQEEQKETMAAIGFGFIFAMISIYALLAIPFGSYIQPIVVMLSIPFGMIGAIIGHLLLGYELSIVSMFGIVALSGVVVNDSLVLIVTANRVREEEKCSPIRSIIEAATRRFRPIILTSLTTFFGLCPIIFETSMQARFLIPMAVSLGFGVLFATLITLLITPAVYLIIEDFKKFVVRNQKS